MGSSHQVPEKHILESLEESLHEQLLGSGVAVTARGGLNRHQCSPRLKRSQDLTNEPLPAPETGDAVEPMVDSETESVALPICGSICPSGGSS